MKTFYLVRHGESTGNAARVSQDGSTDLTKKGRAQAQNIAQRAIHLPLDYIVASSYKRAKQTAEIINKHTNVSLEFSDLFIERKFPSEILGKSYDDPEVLQIQKVTRENYSKPGARYSDEEIFEEQKERARKALDHLHSIDHEHILVVSHAGFIRMLSAYVLFEERLTGDILRQLFKMRMENTGITVLQYNETKEQDQWKLWIWNDHAHLG